MVDAGNGLIVILSPVFANGALSKCSTVLSWLDVVWGRAYIQAGSAQSTELFLPARKAARHIALLKVTERPNLLEVLGYVILEALTVRKSKRVSIIHCINIFYCSTFQRAVIHKQL